MQGLFDLSTTKIQYFLVILKGILSQIILQYNQTLFHLDLLIQTLLIFLRVGHRENVLKENCPALGNLCTAFFHNLGKNLIRLTIHLANIY